MKRSSKLSSVLSEISTGPFYSSHLCPFPCPVSSRSDHACPAPSIFPYALHFYSYVSLLSACPSTSTSIDHPRLPGPTSRRLVWLDLDSSGGSSPARRERSVRWASVDLLPCPCPDMAGGVDPGSRTTSSSRNPFLLDRPPSLYSDQLPFLYPYRRTPYDPPYTSRNPLYNFLPSPRHSLDVDLCRPFSRRTLRTVPYHPFPRTSDPSPPSCPLLLLNPSCYYRPLPSLHQPLPFQQPPSQQQPSRPPLSSS
jgi:hypothetical protein